MLQLITHLAALPAFLHRTVQPLYTVLNGKLKILMHTTCEPVYTAGAGLTKSAGAQTQQGHT